MLSDTVGEQIASWRRRRGWNRQHLADECALRGMPELTRDSIGNIENGRRQEGIRRRVVSVDELAVIASALGIPPVLLVVPVLTAQQIELFPGSETVSTLAAMEWFSGMGTRVRDGDTASDPISTDAVYPLTLLRYHFCLIGMRRDCAEEIKARLEELTTADEVQEVVLRGRQDDLLCRLESLDYEIRALREHFRDRHYPVPELPGDLAYLDSPSRNWNYSAISRAE